MDADTFPSRTSICVIMFMVGTWLGCVCMTVHAVLHGHLIQCNCDLNLRAFASKPPLRVRESQWQDSPSPSETETLKYLK